jgi:Zn-dependent peptidase ImmA (M78 family)
MSSEGVGEYEADDIRKIVARILKDLGSPEPPLNLSQVRALLRLNIGYYSTANTTLLQDIAARMKIAGKQVLERPMLLIEAVTKAKLSALWVPDKKRILIDEAVPKPKHRWIEGHEVGHSVIPRHREFLFGDNEYTLDPICHAIVEAEANYAGSQLLFLQKRFAQEARDGALEFTAINALSKRFGNTLTTTLWRMVEDRDPGAPVFGMVTAHPRYPEIGAGADGNPIRYFIRSRGFRDQFGGVFPGDAYALINRHATRRKRGPVFDASDVLPNVNGEKCEFRLESFCNSHALLTYGVFVRVRPSLVAQ